jgi:hypothetical protein
VLFLQALGIKEPATLLALPPLSEVHLESRISPVELRARAERAAEIARLRKYLQQRRWDRLRASPDVQAAMRRLVERARGRIREHREQQEAARAAEAAALQAAAAAAAPAAAPAGATAMTFMQERMQYRLQYLTPEVLNRIDAVWLGGEHEQQALRDMWLSTDILYYGTTQLSSLHSASVSLAAKSASGAFGDGCPVCRDTQDTWGVWDQQQQQPQQQQPQQQQQQEQQGAALQPHEAAGQQQEPPQQPEAAAQQQQHITQQGPVEVPAGSTVAAAADSAQTRLSVAANEYVPHKLRETHNQSVFRFQVSGARRACIDKLHAMTWNNLAVLGA